MRPSSLHAERCIVTVCFATRDAVTAARRNSVTAPSNIRSDNCEPRPFYSRILVLTVLHEYARHPNLNPPNSRLIQLPLRQSTGDKAVTVRAGHCPTWGTRTWPVCYRMHPSKDVFWCYGSMRVVCETVTHVGRGSARPRISATQAKWEDSRWQ